MAKILTDAIIPELKKNVGCSMQTIFLTGTNPISIKPKKSIGGADKCTCLALCCSNINTLLPIIIAFNVRNLNADNSFVGTATPLSGATDYFKVIDGKLILSPGQYSAVSILSPAYVDFDITQ